jgi:multiple antibiotic resistance protein
MLVNLLAVTAAAGAKAAPASDVHLPEVDLGVQKIFVMLFLMLGPFKVLQPVANLTGGFDRRRKIRIATLAILFSAAALLLAGLAGRQILSNFDISVPVVALTGGLILFVMAFQTVLSQSGTGLPGKDGSERPDRVIAVNPIAFPIIVTPYGIAAVIVFTTLAQSNLALKSVIAGGIAMILAVDWLVMVYADTILKWLGTILQIVAVVLGVVQIALGLQVIFKSLMMMGIVDVPAG